MNLVAQKKPESAGLCLVGTAWVGGDKSGNARGNNALDIQPNRTSPTQVASGDNSSVLGFISTASGSYSSAFGYQNTASNTYASAFGYNNTASGYFASASGSQNTASGTYDSAFGFGNTASNTYASAFGFGNTASGNASSAFGTDNAASGNASSAFGTDSAASGNASAAFGRRVTTTVDNSTEVGYWSGDTVRASAIRLQGTGSVATTIQDLATPFVDGGAVAGSEADGSIGRGMIVLRLNGLELHADYNDGGTVRTLQIGTLA